MTSEGRTDAPKGRRVTRYSNALTGNSLRIYNSSLSSALVVLGSAYNSPANRRYREILEQRNGDYLRVRNQQDEAKKLGREILENMEEENLSFAEEVRDASVNKILKALYDRNKPKPLRVEGPPIPVSEISDKDYLGGVLDNNSKT
jgi:hypothetical protein